MSNEKQHTNYPSRYSIGENVTLNFHKSGKIPNCNIAAVRFDDGKVWYDVFIPIAEQSLENTGYTIIEKVDSVCVEDQAI